MAGRDGSFLKSGNLFEVDDPVQLTTICCMGLNFPVAPRTVLLCDYDMGGFRPPEMVKKRPAVVIMGRLPHRDNLHTVVPLSGTEADPRVRYHCRLAFDQPLPAPFAQQVWWAKADMVATVAMSRLDLFRTERDQFGKRKYLSGLKVTEAQFQQILEALRYALGLVN
ncbi:type II toxin-antitoxin system PemK/MazF family toxin [Parapedomonas caeni]